jgi:4-hydroxy-tetrahydrodipicolinate synthase
MLTADRLKGVFTALLTPFNSDGELDEGMLKLLISRQLDAKINGLVPIGGTGEYFSLSRSERNRVVELAVEGSAKTVPIIPGILATGFHDALEAAKDFSDRGADALMVITPYYTPGTQAGIEDYFRRLRDKTHLPILLYEIPGKTNVSIEAETIRSLADDQTIIGMKYSSYDVPEFIRVADFCVPKIAIMSGEEPLFATHLAIGACGGIMTTANLFPEKWLEIYELVTGGDFRGALKKQAVLDPLMRAAFCESNPGPLKEIMAGAGFSCGGPRVPLEAPKKVVRDNIRKVLSDLQALK